MLTRKWIRIRRATGFLIAYGSSVAVLFLCIAEFFAARLHNHIDEQGYMCNVFVADSSTRAVASLKLTLEPLVLMVYSFGTSTGDKVAYYVRYVALALIVVLCVSVTFFGGSRGPYPRKATVLLFGGVPLEIIGFTELTHVLAVGVLELIEPLRYGSIYPQQGGMSVSVSKKEYFTTRRKCAACRNVRRADIS